MAAPLDALPTGLRVLAYLLIPLLAGWGAGRLLWRVRGRGLRRVWPPAVVAILAGTLLYLMRFQGSIGIWDRVVLLFLAFAGFVSGGTQGGRAAGWRGPCLLLGGAGLALLAGEGVARLLPPLPPPPAGAESRIAFWEGGSDFNRRVCAELTAKPLEPAAAGDSRPLVLHVGGETLAGAGLAGDQALVPVLDRIDPGRRHVEVSSVATGPDVRAGLARARLGSARADWILFYVDTADLARFLEPAGCCPWDSPVDLRGGDGLAANCAEPGSMQRPRPEHSWDPAPYPLRALAGVSALARRVSVAAEGLAVRDRGGLASARLPGDEVDDLLFMVLGPLARRVTADYHMLLVLLPDRAVLEDRSPEALATLERFRAAAARVPIPVVDLNPEYGKLVRRDGSAAWFRTDGDVRLPGLTAAGHAQVARWLASKLDRWTRDAADLHDDFWPKTLPGQASPPPGVPVSAPPVAAPAN